MSEENNNIENSEEILDEASEDSLESDRTFSCAEELLPALEAIMIAYAEPISFNQLADILVVEQELLEEALAALKQRYQAESSGIELWVIAEKYQIRTKNSFSSYIQKLKASKPKKLSPAALETLAIIAYRQPVVKSEVEKIRGVDVSPTLKTLLDRKLIKIAGQQATPGQPSLYATTEEFLKVFGLASLADLPNLREVEEIENSIGEIFGDNNLDSDSSTPNQSE